MKHRCSAGAKGRALRSWSWAFPRGGVAVHKRAPGACELHSARLPAGIIIVSAAPHRNF